MIDQDIMKQLECLFSWAEFYKQNNRANEHAICQLQILEFKEKHGLE